MSKRDSKKRKGGAGSIIILIILLGLIVGLGVAIANNFWSGTTETAADGSNQNVAVEPEPEPEPPKEIKVFNGNTRPIAVMIDNHSDAWPQAGLNDAYLVYEIIVEGGETRLMAVFKDADEETVVGPTRSSRHYFLDYALENDAIYGHYGWSPRAESDIPKLGVNNINGIFYNKPTFWRISDKFAPHNAMTSLEQLTKAAEAKKYPTTSTQESVLNYVADEFDLEDGEDATEVYIPHSYIQKVTYKYDEDTKRYTRYARGKLQKDYNTGDEVTTKNIIIEFCNNSPLNDGTGKDRQDLSNIGTFDGYYITNGKAIEIECVKKSRKEQTVYKDLNGNEINVNDGNTWIHICPKDAKVSIE